VDGVEEFPYLGSIQASSGRSHTDIFKRIVISSAAMHAFHIVWRQRKLSLCTKLRLSLRLRVMDTVEGGFAQTGQFPPQVPAANPGHKMVLFRQECRHYRSHKSPEPGRYNPLSVQLSVWSRG